MTELIPAATGNGLAAQKEYAQLLAASNLLPDAFKANPANVLLAIGLGESVGLHPIAAINGINVIKGKPTFSAQLMASLVRRAGHRLRITSDNTKAVCEIIRSDDPDYTFMTVWDMEKAKTAGLLSNPSWAKYPEAMLKARAISEAVRDACPEVLAGVVYTPEEIESSMPSRTPHQVAGDDPWSRPAPAAIEEVIEGVVDDATV